jgi:hypothetical protein
MQKSNPQQKQKSSQTTYFDKKPLLKGKIIFLPLESSKSPFKLFKSNKQEYQVQRLKFSFRAEMNSEWKENTSLD